MHRTDAQDHWPSSPSSPAGPVGPVSERIPPAAGLTGLVRVAAIVSRYHADITGAMLGDAREALRERVGDGGSLEVFGAPGSFELPVLVSAAARSGRFDAIIALGCIIKGQTSHDEVIAHAVAGELARTASESVVPVGLGVLTVLTVQQARDRAFGPHGRKGRETMHAALDTLAELRALRSAGMGVRP